MLSIGCAWFIPVDQGNIHLSDESFEQLKRLQIIIYKGISFSLRHGIAWKPGLWRESSRPFLPAARFMAGKDANVVFLNEGFIPLSKLLAT